MPARKKNEKEAKNEIHSILKLSHFAYSRKIGHRLGHTKALHEIEEEQAAIKNIKKSILKKNLIDCRKIFSIKTREQPSEK